MTKTSSKWFLHLFKKNRTPELLVHPETWFWKDQDGYELYGYFDAQAGQVVPETLLKAPVLKINNTKRTRQVRIDYVVKNGFTFGSNKDDNGPLLSELGRKAEIRGGEYTHPIYRYRVRNVWMSPKGYLINCCLLPSYKHFGNWEGLYKSRENYNVVAFFDRYYGNIPAPMLDWYHQTQNGAHRAVYALKKDLPEIPVTLIETGDRII